MQNLTMPHASSSRTNDRNELEFIRRSSSPHHPETKPIRDNPSSWNTHSGRRRRSTRRDLEATGKGDGVILPLTYVGTSAFDATYTLPLLVGTNEQKLFVQVDTGSPDLWFASTDCSDSSCPDGRKRSTSQPQSSTAFMLEYKRQYHPFLNATKGKHKSRDHRLSARREAPLYDSSQSESFLATGVPVTIQYLIGQVEGLIVWDRVGLDIDGDEDGIDAEDWTIGAQAFISASSLISEPLSSKFSGVLGLSPPSTSVISQHIPPTDSDAPDGAMWTSNIFGSSTNLTERSRFISMMFNRVDGGVLSPQNGAVMSIGTLPNNDAYPEFWSSDEANTLDNVTFTRPVPSVDRTSGQIVGTTLWRVSVPSLQVQGKAISLPTSMSAILDSGVPTILAPKTIADGIYGALDIGPASDGNYYVPCSTALTFNVTLQMNLGGGDMAFPVHPLDSSERRGNKNECMGTIQASDGVMENEFVFGVAFLRSVEVVWGYDGEVGLTGAGTGGAAGVKLGLRTLVGGEAWEKAMDEWRTVRIDGQSLAGASIGPGGGSGEGKPNPANTGNVSKVGIIALAVIGTLAGVCIIMFGLWRWVVKRKEKEIYYSQAHPESPTAAAALFPGDQRSSRFDDGTVPGKKIDKKGLGGLLVGLLRPKDADRTLSGGGGYPMKDLEPSEDEKRQSRYEAYMARQNLSRSEGSGSGSASKSGVLLGDYGQQAGGLGEFGEPPSRGGPGAEHDRERTLVLSESNNTNTLMFSGYGKEDPWDPSTGLDWGGRGGETDILLSTDDEHHTKMK